MSRKQKVTLSFDWCGKEERREVEANVVRDFFALHREVNLDHRGEPVYLGMRWTVSHLPSGLTLARPRTYRDAQLAANMFSRLPIEWGTVTKEGLEGWPTEVREEAKRIRDNAASGTL